MQKNIFMSFIFLVSLSTQAQSDQSNLGCARMSDMNKPECMSMMTSAPIKKTVLQGRKIVIDTQDREVCEKIKNQISSSGFSESKDSLNLNSLCNSDLNNPEDRYRVITTLNETTEQYVTQINMKALTNADNNLLNDTRNLSYLMVGAVGLIWLMPESISKWDKNDVTSRGFFQKYKDNVTNGPVIDKDDWAINYIGHPISGAAYYMIARNNGYTKMQSFGYSALMSTFFWEYGVEAFAEKPSIQDLLSTPIIGSLMGEVFYNWSEKIKSGDDRILGSKKLGKVVLYVLNPAQELSKSINQVLGHRVIQNAKTEFILSRKKSNDPINPGTSNYIGIQLRFQW